MDQYRKSPRASFLNYDEGDYFVTICTKDKVHYFGEIYGGGMHLNKIGSHVDKLLKSAHSFCDYVEVPIYVVMPNHVHMIVSICKEFTMDEVNTGMIQRAPNPVFRANPTCQRHVPTLSNYINSFKGAVTKYARSCNMDFAWQKRYHDHLIRGTKDGNNIWNYILNNVARWQDDCFYRNS